MLQRQSAPFETIEASYKSFLLGLPIVGAEIEVGINRVGSFVGPTIERRREQRRFSIFGDMGLQGWSEAEMGLQGLVQLKRHSVKSSRSRQNGGSVDGSVSPNDDVPCAVRRGLHSQLRAARVA